MFFASKSTQGFYNAETASSVPADAVEISELYRNQMVDGERAGRVIAWGDDGVPYLIDPPPPTEEALAVIERRWRDEQLQATDSIVTRHRDERDGGVLTTLNSAQYSQLLAYRQSLRNWPQTEAFPESPQDRPLAPDWLAPLNP